MNSHKKILIVLITLLLHLPFQSFGQSKEIPKEERLVWFKDAKLGIFIHWGIYAVNGIDESWSFYNNYISYTDYMKQLNGFTAKNYNPKKWAKLIKESGAKYTVITTKHHDGVALWNTKQNDLSVVKKNSSKKRSNHSICKCRSERKHKSWIVFFITRLVASRLP